MSSQICVANVEIRLDEEDKLIDAIKFWNVERQNGNSKGRKGRDTNHDYSSPLKLTRLLINKNTIDVDNI